MTNGIYEKAREIADIQECYFYHTMDIPGHGHVMGEWDLRGKEHEYLGKMNFGQKRVLEVGTADGFLCFYMERQGADVVAYDLSDDHAWDVVPFAVANHEEWVRARANRIRRLNNAWWFCHEAFGSKAKLVFGTVYAIPREIGPVDISTVTAVLLHVRDPFLALQNVLSLTKETVVITEPFWARFFHLRLLGGIIGPCMRFWPQLKDGKPSEPSTWWALPPATIKRFLQILGFEKTRVYFHIQKREFAKPHLQPFITVVGHRTQKSASRVSG